MLSILDVISIIIFITVLFVYVRNKDSFQWPKNCIGYRPKNILLVAVFSFKINDGRSNSFSQPFNKTISELSFSPTNMAIAAFFLESFRSWHELYLYTVVPIWNLSKIGLFLIYEIWLHPLFNTLKLFNSIWYGIWSTAKVSIFKGVRQSVNQFHNVLKFDTFPQLLFGIWITLLHIPFWIFQYWFECLLLFFPCRCMESDYYYFLLCLLTK